MRIESLTLLLISGAMSWGVAWAHADQAPAAKNQQKEPVAEVPETKAAVPDARSYFTDLELVTQDGKKVRFYSDMLEGRIVLINVVYTNCKDACPLITQKLNEVRAQIGELFGTEVYFVTISSDPVRDTPKALKAFAKKQGAEVTGWTFLTGNKKNIDQILKRLGQFSENIEEHSTLLIAGNVPAKRWSKIRPDAPSLAIAERLKLLASPNLTAPPGAEAPKTN
jgi:protein SCO1